MARESRTMRSRACARASGDKEYLSKNGGVKGAIEEEMSKSRGCRVHRRSVHAVGIAWIWYCLDKVLRAANVRSPARSIEVDETEVSRG